MNLCDQFEERLQTTHRRKGCLQRLCPRACTSVYVTVFRRQSEGERVRQQRGRRDAWLSDGGYSDGGWAGVAAARHGLEQLPCLLVRVSLRIIRVFGLSVPIVDSIY